MLATGGGAKPAPSYGEVTVDHTLECQAKEAEARRATIAWCERWPNHCPTCTGAGVVGWYENQAPLGSGQVWNEHLEEPCPACTAEGKCARCGKMGLDPETSEGPCRACGWNYDDACPPPWECQGCVKHEYPDVEY